MSRHQRLTRRFFPRSLEREIAVTHAKIAVMEALLASEAVTTTLAALSQEERREALIDSASRFIEDREDPERTPIR